jgi:hypothetical protein
MVDFIGKEKGKEKEKYGILRFNQDDRNMSPGYGLKVGLRK